jgi:hypothetical protein
MEGWKGGRVSSKTQPYIALLRQQLPAPNRSPDLREVSAPRPPPEEPALSEVEGFHNDSAGQNPVKAAGPRRKSNL